jgi:hypothetical protein
MRKSLLLAFVSMFAVASVALAATGGKAPPTTLVQAVDRTNHAPSLRYVLDITVTRPRAPVMSLHVRGMRGQGSLFIHLQALADSTPGPQQSVLIDGPFLYEGAPNGIAIGGKVRWLRFPIARIGAEARPIQTMHNLSPAPLLRLLDEWSGGKRRSTTGAFHGRVAYDDPIVQTALAGMTGGIQFRDVHFSARVGADGYVHTISVSGRTADGTRTLSVTAHLYAFGRPVNPRTPREGTFVDQKLIGLAE